jgi:multidrug efflux pump subunit AcrB
VFGAREYAVRVWLNPDRLAAFALTTTDVVSALQEQNIQVAGGALGAAPSPQDSGLQLTVQTQGRFENVRQFENVIVKSRVGDSSAVRDVARVELGARATTTRNPT